MIITGANCAETGRATRAIIAPSAHVEQLLAVRVPEWCATPAGGHLPCATIHVGERSRMPLHRFRLVGLEGDQLPSGERENAYSNTPRSRNGTTTESCPDPSTSRISSACRLFAVAFPFMLVKTTRRPSLEQRGNDTWVKSTVTTPSGSSLNWATDSTRATAGSQAWVNGHTATRPIRRSPTGNRAASWWC